MANKQVKNNLKQQPIKQTKVKTSFIKDFFRKENFDCKTLESKLFVTAFVIFFISLIAKFYNSLFFLPYYSIDENEVVEYSVALMGDNKDPIWYQYGSFFWYILGFVYKILSFFSCQDTENYVKDVFFDSEKFYYIARILCSFINIITYVFIYKIAKELFNKNVALISLIFLFLPFLELFIGFTVRIDALLGLCSVATIWFSIKAYKENKLKYYLLSGLFAGFCFATKPLPSISIIPTVFLVILLKHLNFKNKLSIKTIPRILRDKYLYVLIIAIFIGNFIGNPYSILNFKGFWQEQMYVFNVASGTDSYVKGYDILTHFVMFGYVFIVLFLISFFYILIKAFKNKNTSIFIALSYLVTYWLMFATKPSRSYWFITIVPLIFMLISYFVYDVIGYFKNNKIQNFKYLIVLAFVVLIIYHPLVLLIERNSNVLRYSDYKHSYTLTQAKDWIDKNIDKNSEILMYGGSTGMPKLLSSSIDYYIPIQKESRSGQYFGDYFMYHRGEIQWYVELFAKAHQDYVMSHKEIAFNNLDAISYNKPIQEVLNFCINYKKEILITNIKDFNDIKYFKNRTIKSFENKEYINGPEIYIYRLAITIKDTIRNASNYEDCSINGCILYNFGDINKGLSYYEKAYKYKSNDEKQVLFLAQKFFEAKNIGKAGYYYDQAVKINPKNVSVLQERAIFNFNIKQFDKAIADLSFIIKLDSKNYYAYYCRGICYLNKNDRQGISDLQIAADNGFEDAKKILSNIK